MKRIFTIAFAVMLTISAATSFAQTDSTGMFKLRNYTLYKGVSYFFLMTDDAVVQGRVIGFNENEILIAGDNVTIVLKKEEIRVVSNEYITDTGLTHRKDKSKYIPLWIIGAGTVSPQGNSHFTTYHNFKTAGDYKRGFSIYGGRITPISGFGAVKLECDYTHLPNGDNYYRVGDDYESSETGGTIDEFTFRAGLGAGNFNDNEGFILDAFISLCAGMYFRSSAAFYEKMTGYINSDTVYTSAAFSQALFGIDMNISLKINLSKKFGISLEPHIVIYSSGNAPLQTVLKAGAFF